LASGVHWEDNVGYNHLLNGTREGAYETSINIVLHVAPNTSFTLVHDGTILGNNLATYFTDSNRVKVSQIKKKRPLWAADVAMAQRRLNLKKHDTVTHQVLFVTLLPHSRTSSFCVSGPFSLLTGAAGD
jgi:hypothetical protein